MNNSVFTATYDALEIPIPGSPIDYGEYLSMLSLIQNDVENIDMRIFPTSFDPNKTTFAFLRSVFWKWKSLADFLQNYKAIGVLIRLPLFWQIEPLAFEACKTSKSFLFINDETNMPVGRTAIQSAEMNTVVTTAKDAVEFLDYLEVYDAKRPKNLFIVHPFPDVNIELTQTITDTRLIVAQEIHFFPGIPLFSQCNHIVSMRHTHNFHLSDGYYVSRHQNDNVFVISGTKFDALPLLMYQLPSWTHQTGNFCNCGKELFLIGK
jgi:hypothetical protein